VEFNGAKSGKSDLDKQVKIVYTNYQVAVPVRMPSTARESGKEHPDRRRPKRPSARRIPYTARIRRSDGGGGSFMGNPATGGDMAGPTLVVLAAGIGSRYGGLKQLDAVGPNGELIIDYSVYDALHTSFGRVVFVINKAIEAEFRDRVGKRIENQCETIYVHQSLEDVPAGFQVPPNRHKPWGTAHATLACKGVVHSPFAVINSDDFYGRSAYQALHDYLERAEDRDGAYDYCMVGYVLENTLTEHGHVARGVCVVDQHDFLVQIRERTRIRMAANGAEYSEDGEHWVGIPKGSIASLNFWGFTLSLFEELEVRFGQFLAKNRERIETAEYFLPDLVGELISEQRALVRVLPTDERWFGVTYQEDKPRVKQAIEDLIRRGVYPETLWEDVR
jgi:hypothetical protein